MSTSMPMPMSKDITPGLEEETMDSSSSHATRLMIGLLWFRLCILLMVGPCRASTGAESMLAVNEMLHEE